MLLRYILNEHIGKMVWFFVRTVDQAEFSAKPGILLKHHSHKMLCDILFNNDIINVADTDVIPMEVWDEDLERKNGPMEISRKRSRDHGGDSIE
jgi:hypothetical protein